MEQLRARLASWLAEQFPDAELTLEPVRPQMDLSGIVAWHGFDGLEPIDRQRLLLRALRAHFSPEDVARIAILITLSPAEYAVYKREQSVDREPLAA